MLSSVVYMSSDVGPTMLAQDVEIECLATASLKDLGGEDVCLAIFGEDLHWQCANASTGGTGITIVSETVLRGRLNRFSTSVGFILNKAVECPSTASGSPADSLTGASIAAAVIVSVGTVTILLAATVGVLLWIFVFRKKH